MWVILNDEVMVNTDVCEMIEVVEDKLNLGQWHIAFIVNSNFEENAYVSEPLTEVEANKAIFDLRSAIASGQRLYTL